MIMTDTNNINLSTKPRCLGTPCKTQTITINMNLCIGGRFEVTPDTAGETCFTLIPYDIDDNIELWRQFTVDLYNSLLRCSSELNCDTPALGVFYSINGDEVTITIYDSPITLLYIEIIGGDCDGDIINFIHNC